MVLEGLWGYILGGATVFGAIVAIAAWYNGRTTRRFLAELIVEEGRGVKELIAKMDQHIAKMDEHLAKIDEYLVKVDEHLVKMDERFAKIDGRFAKIDERFEALLKSIEEHTKASLTQHAELLRTIKEK